MAKAKTQAVIICTDKRGVFFGYVDEAPTDIIKVRTVVLKKARMCVHWSVATKGVLGLASAGPAKGSRVTDAIPSIALDGVHAVLDMTPEAIQRWADPPWA
jgi:hypothetical protein